MRESDTRSQSYGQNTTAHSELPQLALQEITAFMSFLKRLQTKKYDLKKVGVLLM
jgi:hypothetical protein